MINLEKHFNLPIAKNMKYWIILPLVIIVLAGIMFGVYCGVYKDVKKGMNIGIDFAGGSIMTVTLGTYLNDSNYDEYEELIRDAIEKESIGQEVLEYGVSDEYKERYNDNTIVLPNANAGKATITYSQSSGSDDEYAIVFKYDNVSTTYDADNTLSAKRNELIKESVVAALQEKLTDVQYDEIKDMITYENIGATASLDLIKTALMCLAISLAIILVYIIIRFEIWSGIAAVVALIHDVLILVSLTIVFHIQVNSSFVAAIITIVSYSIKNTIVVFDRLRENVKNEKKLNAKYDISRLIDVSIKQTLQRSINATLTTMVTIVIFAIFGSSTVNEFALPVIFGLVAGFYSSMFIAPALYYILVTAHEKNKQKRKEKKLQEAAASKPKYVGAK